MTTARSMMTVGELSRRTGVSAKALRDYTDWGLIQTPGRSSANYRLYEAEALRCVQLINELRGLGLTLAEIRAGLRVMQESPERVGLWLAERLHAARQRIQRQLAQLEDTRRRIDEFEDTHRAELCGHDQLWTQPIACPPAA